MFARIFEKAKEISANIAVLLILCVTTAVISPSFFTLNNLMNILAQMVPFFILGAGQTIIIISGGIDLSVGAVGGLAGVVTGYMLMMHNPIIICVIAGLAVGASFGFLNGIIISKVKINTFITTFGIRLIALGILSWYFVSKIMYDFPPAFRFIGIGRIGVVPFVIIVAILVLAALHFLMHFTTFGRLVYLVGSNSTATRMSGIDTDKVIVLSYVISGIVAAFAVIILIARGNTASSRVAEGLELMAIAAALLGGASFQGGVGRIRGAFLGAFILTLLGNVISLVGISILWQRLVTGVIMIVVVFGNEIVQKRILYRKAAR
jgi:ribose transport system permease protein